MTKTDYRVKQLAAGYLEAALVIDQRGDGVVER
jgi:hypothetical protein